jgi:hypothetical protein
MIQVGDKVRSFDFAQGDFGRELYGDRACYVEGVVESFVEREGCPRYEVRVEVDVFGGEESDRRVGNLVYPPVNGTPKSFGGACDNVELV